MPNNASPTREELLSEVARLRECLAQRQAGGCLHDTLLREVYPFADLAMYRLDAGDPARSYLDESLLRLTGLAREALDGKPLDALLPLVDPRDREALAEALAQSLANAGGDEARCTAEFRFRRGDGALRWLRLWNVARRASGAAPWTHHGLLQDITGQKSAEETLRDIFETAPFPITVTTPREGELLYANRNAHLFYGLDPDSGKRVFTPPVYVDVGAREAIVKKILAEGEASGIEIEMRLANGQTRWMSFSAKLFQYGGRPAIMSAQFDITSRKLLENQLKASEAKFRMLTEGIADVIWQMDANHRFTYVSPADERERGYKPEEVIGRHFSEFVDEESLKLLQEKIRLREEQEKQGHRSDTMRYEVRQRRKDGSYIWTEIFSTAEHDAAGRITGFHGIARNITERKETDQALQEAHASLEKLVGERTGQLEAAKAQLERDIEALKKAEEEKEALEIQLRQSQVMEAVGLLAGGVAHDFNNLLASMLSCLHNVRGRAGADAALTEEIRRIEDLCKRGGDLTRRLLSFARRIPGRKEAVDLTVFLADLQSLLERTLPKLIHLRFAVEPGLPHIQADRSLLTAAMLNLATNARDAMPQGGTFSLSAHSALSGHGDPEVILRVSDTGSGIPDEIRERVFEPFFTTKPVGHGTGLGLAMVFAFVKDCQGEIAVQSSAERGTIFTLKFPARHVLGAPTTADAGAEARHPLIAERILVVEDEAQIREFTERILADNGYRTLSAESGLEALENLGRMRGQIGLVALDLMMPKLGGDKVHRILKSLAPEVPVLFITGRPDMAASLDDEGVVLAKPFTREELMEAVARALDPLRR